MNRLSVFLLSVLFGSTLFTPARGQELPFGIVRLGSGNILGSGTGVLVGPQHILTAAHNLGKSASSLLNFGGPMNGGAPPYTEVVGVLQSGGSVRELRVEIVSVSLFPKTFFSNGKRPKGENEGDRFAHTIEVGDFAVLQLRDPIEIPRGTKLPQIVVEEINENEELVVGGFGRRTSIIHRQSNYVHALAGFGSLRNPFAYDGAKSFKKQSKVAVEILNRSHKDFVLAHGDSGGPVLQKRGNQFYIRGVIHAEPAAPESNLAGFAHIFRPAYKEVVSWLKSVLPQEAFLTSSTSHSSCADETGKMKVKRK